MTLSQLFLCLSSSETSMNKPKPRAPTSGTDSGKETPKEQAPPQQEEPQVEEVKEDGPGEMDVD